MTVTLVRLQECQHLRVVRYRLPKEAVDTPSLEALKTKLDTVLGSLMGGSH